MNIIKTIYLGFFSLIFILSCSESDSGMEQVSFYGLEEYKSNAVAASEHNLNTLTLSEKPLFTSNEMEYYIWNEHTFSLDTNILKNFHDYVDSNISVTGIPFVVTVNDERIYLGAFWFGYSSIAPPVPYTEMSLFVYMYPDSLITTFTINEPWFNGAIDPRGDRYKNLQCFVENR